MIHYAIPPMLCLIIYITMHITAYTCTMVTLCTSQLGHNTAGDYHYSFRVEFFHSNAH